jgi:hypothetical protein
MGGNPIDFEPVAGTYFGRVAAVPDKDLEIPLGILITQHLSFPRILPRLDAVATRIQLFGAVLENIAPFPGAVHKRRFMTAAETLETGADLIIRLDNPKQKAIKGLLERQPHAVIGADEFQFELYASGEYSRKLELGWEGSSEPSALRRHGS